MHIYMYLYLCVQTLNDTTTSLLGKEMLTALQILVLHVQLLPNVSLT